MYIIIEFVYHVANRFFPHSAIAELLKPLIMAVRAAIKPYLPHISYGIFVIGAVFVVIVVVLIYVAARDSTRGTNGTNSDAILLFIRYVIVFIASIIIVELCPIRLDDGLLLFAYIYLMMFVNFLYLIMRGLICAIIKAIREWLLKKI